MAKGTGKTIMCDSCTAQECRKSYPDGIPDYCLAAREKAVLERTKAEYAKPGTLEIYMAAAKTMEAGYASYPRIQEAIEFCKELKVKKVGLASCIGLIRELGLVARLFTGAGFEIVAANCQIGKISPGERVPDLKPEDFHHKWCNPIAQAEIMNEEGTDVNFVIGLCLGHDMLFNKYAKAPTSTLIVKDRVLGHNPAAALYASPHRTNLFKKYTGKAE